MGAKFTNMRVLNSYWINQDATFKYYEVGNEDRSSLVVVLRVLFCIHATTSARQPLHAWFANETRERESAGIDFRDLLLFHRLNSKFSPPSSYPGLSALAPPFDFCASLPPSVLVIAPQLPVQLSHVANRPRYQRHFVVFSLVPFRR